MSISERRARNKANLREEILDAARTLFLRDGYEQVSLRKIADRIDYAPGTIYLHFQDKADIFRTICNETFGKLHHRLAAIAADTCSPLEKLRRAGHSYVQFALENPQHYALVFLTRSENAVPSTKEAAQDIGFLCFQDLCQIVQQCIEQNLLHSQDVMQISQTMWASVHGVAALLIVKCDFPFIEHNRLIDSVLDTMLQGIRKPSS